jgi:hypothetical protein
MAALQRFDDGIKQGWQMVFQILVRKTEALSSRPRIRADPLAPANQQALPAGFELIPDLYERSVTASSIPWASAWLIGYCVGRD